VKSFNPGFLEKQPITQNLLQTIRGIAEYKGKQDLYKEQSPQVLETLRQAAIIQSTESSNRLEGITAPLERIKELVAKKTTPKNRSEQEIAGYRDVLNTIHANYADIPFTTGLVLQFHRDRTTLTHSRLCAGFSLHPSVSRWQWPHGPSSNSSFAIQGWLRSWPLHQPGADGGAYQRELLRYALPIIPGLV